MFYKEYTRELDPEVFPENPGQITVYANHYANKVIVQLRVNGELDSTYEVRAKGLGHEETGFAFEQNTEDDEDYAPIRDPLSNYDVSTRPVSYTHLDVYKRQDLQCRVRYKYWNDRGYHSSVS